MHRPSKLPKYVKAYTDRHGKGRYYYRRKGYPQAPLPGMPWSPAFMEAYEVAANAPKPEIGTGEGRASVDGCPNDLVAPDR